MLELSINESIKTLNGYESIFMGIVQREKENLASNLSKFQDEMDTQSIEQNINNIEIYMK